jgi:hypothetical protein
MRPSSGSEKWQNPGKRLARSPAWLPPGAHVATPRFGYTHHGIYVGGGKVVQYSGLARSLRGGPIEEIMVEQFTDGHPLWRVDDQPNCFEGEEVVRRARSRLGETRYRLLTNNCEHFCWWCLCAQQRSYQVERWFSGPGRAVRVIADGIQAASLACMRGVQMVVRRLHPNVFAASTSEEGETAPSAMLGQRCANLAGLR